MVVKKIEKELTLEKSFMLKQAYKQAPTLDKDVVEKGIQKFLEKHTDKKYIKLSSRDVNYFQVFVVETEDYNKVAKYIYDFLEESVFITFDGHGNQVSKVMSDIKDISDINDYALGLWIEDVFFVLEVNNWIVEEIK